MIDFEYTTNIEDTFENVKDLINHTVWTYWRQRPWHDVEELQGIAYLCFVSAYQKYDVNQSSFVTFLRFVIWKRFQDWNKLYFTKNRPTEELPAYDQLPCVCRESNAAIIDLLDCVSAHAKEVIYILCTELPNRQPKKGGTWYTMRQELKHILQDEMGWHKTSVELTFEEIKEAL